jgi:hypothetical protein
MRIRNQRLLPEAARKMWHVAVQDATEIEHPSLAHQPRRGDDLRGCDLVQGADLILCAIA